MGVVILKMGEEEKRRVRCVDNPVLRTPQGRGCLSSRCFGLGWEMVTQDLEELDRGFLADQWVHLH